MGHGEHCVDIHRMWGTGVVKCGHVLRTPCGCCVCLEMHLVAGSDRMQTVWKMRTALKPLYCEWYNRSLKQHIFAAELCVRVVFLCYHNSKFTSKECVKRRIDH